ncbi:hypothetical protein EGW08_017346 [Elysia chlorotica]|uniref:AIG1-type G domain-containing protein n=1 Tax=Elysia chlorotica TaxID=188477 RepID=A0A433T033_ELYCH|nr:hypothetical protein EGW08_017346 [Elysia chlorotica]
MSTDLSIWIYGCRTSPLIPIANRVLGSQEFTNQGPEERRGIGSLRHARKVRVAIKTLPVPLMGSFDDDLFVGTDAAHRFGLQILENTKYADVNAVIIIVHIFPDFSVFIPPAVLHLMQDSNGRGVLKEKGLLIMTGRDRFLDARREGDFDLTFLNWCRQNTTAGFQDLFQLVKERCVLFDDAGTGCTPDTWRNELIEMIDRDVVGGTHFISVKFQDVEMRIREVEIRLDEMQRQIQKKTASENMQVLRAVLKDLKLPSDSKEKK